MRDYDQSGIGKQSYSYEIINYYEFLKRSMVFLSTLSAVALLALFSLSIIFNVSLVPVVHADMSPLKQFRQGIAIQDIMCNNDKILLESPHGKPACVVSKTSERLLDRGYVLVVQTKDIAPQDIAPQDDTKDNEHLPLKERIRRLVVELKNNEVIIHDKQFTYDANGSLVTTSTGIWHQYPTEDFWDQTTKPLSTDPFVPSPEQLAHIQNITQYNLYAPWEPYMIQNTDALPRLPNLGGDWVPIRDKEEFVARLTAATGDKYVGIGKSGNFKTEKGLIILSDVVSTTGPPFVEVAYILNEPMRDEDDHVAFIDNFMKNMGYEWTTVNGAPMTMKYWADNCHVEFGYDRPHNRECRDPYAKAQYMPPYTSYAGDGLYIASQKYSRIYFTMYGPDFSDQGLPSVKIYVDGWTNNPYQIEFQLDRYIAFKKAYEFAANAFMLNRPDDDHEEKHFDHCDWDFLEDSVHAAVADSARGIKNIIISGVPYYQIVLGFCDGVIGTSTGPNGHDFHKMMIFVDGWIGEHVFIVEKGLER